MKQKANLRRLARRAENHLLKAMTLYELVKQTGDEELIAHASNTLVGAHELSVALDERIA